MLTLPDDQNMNSRFERKFNFLDEKSKVFVQTMNINSDKNSLTANRDNFSESNPPRSLQKFKQRYRKDGGDISDYLMSVERYGDLYNIPDRDLILLALMNFESIEQANSIESFLTFKEQNSWKPFCEKLIQAYGKSSLDYFDMFDNACRNKTQSSAYYLAQLTAWLKRAKNVKFLSKDDQETVVRKFKSTVHPDLKAYLEVKQCSDYSEIAQVANRYERAYKIPREKPVPVINVCAEKEQNGEKPSKSKNNYCEICTISGHSTKHCFFNNDRQKSFAQKILII